MDGCGDEQKLAARHPRRVPRNCSFAGLNQWNLA